VGTPKSPADGWLLIDRSYQDVGFAANFKCGAGCKTGVLSRAEKTPDGGMKGIYLSMTEGEVGHTESRSMLAERSSHVRSWDRLRASAEIR
jgi:hypothetical protein